MNFNEVIKIELGPFLIRYGFAIVEEMSNIIQFESESISIRIAYRNREYTNVLFIGEKNNIYKTVEIYGEVLKSFFKTDIDLTSGPPESFAKNLIIFFENEAKSIIMGDLNEMEKLYQFSLILSKKYNEELFSRTTVQDLDKEWEKENYREFIKVADEMRLRILPASMMDKYNAAKKKVLEPDDKYDVEFFEQTISKDPDKEWEKGNYIGYINLMDMMTLNFLPSPYKTKYEIAQRKLLDDF